MQRYEEGRNWGVCGPLVCHREHFTQPRLNKTSQSLCFSTSLKNNSVPRECFPDTFDAQQPTAQRDTDDFQVSIIPVLKVPRPVFSLMLCLNLVRMSALFAPFRSSSPSNSPHVLKFMTYSSLIIISNTHTSN